MAAIELNRNHKTNYCLFYIDDFENDSKNLPTSKESGKVDMKLSKPCCFGSIAKCADGTSYILNGSDEWVVYNTTQNDQSLTDSDIATDEEVEELLDDVFINSI